MESELINSSNSSNSVTSDDEFNRIENGQYVKFECVDDVYLNEMFDISPNELSRMNGNYISFEKFDDVNLQREVNRNCLFINNEDEQKLDYSSKYNEVVEEIKSLQILTENEKMISPSSEFDKRTQEKNCDLPAKQRKISFLQKIKSERYSRIFRRKSKLSSSLPKIVIASPQSPKKDNDSGNDTQDSNEETDMNIVQKKIDQFEKWSSSQKLIIKNKIKTMRKSI